MPSNDAQLASNGQLTPGVDPDALAVEIIALMDGLQVQWVLDPGAFDMAAVLRHRLDAVLTEPIDSRHQPTKEQG